MARALSRQAAHQQGSAGAGPPGAGRVKTSPPRRVGPAMGILSATGLDRFNPAQSGVRGMRIVATGLLVLMAALYAGARAMETRHPGWGYLRAFAEAAMVGGMADWFAVTALFRHPLGLPIPHTAI